MSAQQRRKGILRRLLSTGEISFAALATEYQVSEMTIRRDIESLEAAGQARRVRGGAISVLSRSYEPPFGLRRITAAGAKQAIGQAAARLLSDGDTCILDIGTTTGALAHALRGRSNLTIVTASLPIAVELGNEPELRVVVTGGQVRSGELSLTGGMAEEAFATVNCDLAFIGVAGICPDPGLTDYNPDDARVKRAALRAARRAIVLADESKLGRITFATVAPLQDIDTLVTDAPSDHPVVLAVREVGVQVVHASDGSAPGEPASVAG